MSALFMFSAAWRQCSCCHSITSAQSGNGLADSQRMKDMTRGSKNPFSSFNEGPWPAKSASSTSQGAWLTGFWYASPKLKMKQQVVRLVCEVRDLAGRCDIFSMLLGCIRSKPLKHHCRDVMNAVTHQEYGGCSGKSTVGTILGTILKYPFLDTDALIESSTKMPIKDIFAEDGEASFRELETQVLQVCSHAHTNVMPYNRPPFAPSPGC